MILVDTSVWVDHLRRGDATLTALLEGDSVAVHPFVIGELACGSLRRPADLLRLLYALPSASTASHAEVMHFIAARRLGACGVGYADAHLLASASVDELRLWTRDKALARQAKRLSIGFDA